MADFDTISISSDDSETPFMDDGISEDTHKVFLVENEQKPFLNDRHPFGFEEKLDEHVEVKQEVLVSFASIDSIKKEVEKRLYYNENSIEIPEESEEMVTNEMNEIEYNLCSTDRSFFEPRDIIGSRCQQENYNVNLEQPAQIEEDSDLVIQIDSDDGEDSAMSHSSMMKLLAKGLAETLGNDEPSTVSARNVLMTNNIDNSTGDSININQNVQWCSDINRNQNRMKVKSKSKKLLNLENTIFNVSIGNCSVTFEDINAIHKNKTNHNFMKLQNKFKKTRYENVMLEKENYILMKANSFTIDHNTNYVTLSNGSKYNGMTTMPMERTHHLLNNQEVQHNGITVPFNESDVMSNYNRQNDGDTASEPKRKKRKYNKSPQQKDKESFNKMEKDLAKAIKEFNSNLVRLRKEYENRDKMNSLALEMSENRDRTNSLALEMSAKRKKADKPLLEKLKLSIDRNSGSISIVPPPKPMVACKPIQRHSATATGSTSFKTVLSPGELELSNIQGAPTQLENGTAIETNGTQDLSVTSINPLNDRLFRARFVKCYGLVFDSDGQRICTEMGDLLLVSLKEYRTFITRLEMAKKLSSDQRQSETSCALKSYNNTASRYILSFEGLFMEIHRKICENQTIINLGQCKTLLIAWFLKIFLRASNISPELSDSLEEVKHHMLTELFVNVKQNIPIVHETFGTNSTRFQQDCWQALDLMKDVFEEDEESVREEPPSAIPHDVTYQNQGVVPTRDNTFVSNDVHGNVTPRVDVITKHPITQLTNSENKFGSTNSISQTLEVAHSSAASSNTTINNQCTTSTVYGQQQVGCSVLNAETMKMAHSSASPTNLITNNQYSTSTSNDQSQVSLEPSSRNDNRNNYREYAPNKPLGSSITHQQISKLNTNPPQKPRNAAHQQAQVIPPQQSWEDHIFFKSTVQSENASSETEENERILTLEQLLTPTSTLTSPYFKSQQVFLPLENSATSSQQQLNGSKTNAHEENNGALVPARRQAQKDNQPHKLLNSSDVSIRIRPNKVSGEKVSSGLSPTPKSNSSVCSAATNNLMNNSIKNSEAGLNSVTPGSFQNNDTTNTIHRLLANSHPTVTLHYRPAQ